MIKRVQCEKGGIGSYVVETCVGWGKSIQIEYEHPARRPGYFMLIKTLINKVEPIQDCSKGTACSEL